MRSTLFAVGFALLSISSSFAEQKAFKECQSQGRYEGRMVYIDLFPISVERHYRAVFKEAEGTDTKRSVFLRVPGIHEGDTAFSGRSALVDDNGLEFTTDEDDRSASWVDYVENGKRKHIALSCRTNKI